MEAQKSSSKLPDRHTPTSSAKLLNVDSHEGKATATTIETGDGTLRHTNADTPKNAAEISSVDRAARYLDLAVSNMGTGLFFVGENDAVVYCNPKLLELLGIKESQVLDSGYISLFRRLAALSQDPENTQRELETALRTLGRKSPMQVTLDLHSMMGRLQVQFFPLPPGEIGWGSIVRDVTAEWREITSRTEHLSLLTRELRLPLAKIKGFMTTMLDGHPYWEEAERQTFLENIYKGVDQLSRLLETAQGALKLQLGASNLNRRPTDIKTLIKQVTRSMALRISGYQIALDIPNNLPEVEIDPRRIEQLLHHLLDNATQHAPTDSKIEIVVRMAKDDLTINVIDQGPAIPDEHLAHLFEPAYIVGVSDSERVTDAVLGLYIAHELVVAHGGHIWAENSPGHRVTLSVSLPIKTRVVEHLEPTRLPTVAKAKDRAKTKAHQRVLKVLVAEDDPQMARLLKIMLESSDYQVIIAEQGEQALELAVTKKPDIILLDNYLPDMDGLDVCMQLREFSTVPIIMVSVNQRSADVARALEHGADDYVFKPFSQKELLARIAANLRRASYPEEPQTSPFFHTGDLTIDFDQRRVVVRGETAKLTPTEYKVLYHLAANAGRMLSHEQILSKVWGPECQTDTQYLWVNISRLRRKLELDPANPEYILTEPGVGYYVPGVANQTAAD
ncbi:MAG: response regulator [Chloroflexota bacterium]